MKHFSRRILMKTSLKRFDFSAARLRSGNPLFTVPFLDFIFLAGLIFALSQNRLLFSRGMPVDLPQPSSTSEIVDSASCLGVLTMDKEGMLFLDGERCSFESLGVGLDRLDKPAARTPTLLVKADRKVSIESFVRATEILRSRGIKAVLVAVQEGPRP